jgi:hypothetical protein
MSQRRLYTIVFGLFGLGAVARYGSALYLMGYEDNWTAEQGELWSYASMGTADRVAYISFGYGAPALLVLALVARWLALESMYGTRLQKRFSKEQCPDHE